MPQDLSAAPDVDAVLIVSFGGPEGPADVLPFLENVTRGRGIPRERLAQVGEHYHRFGGVSPINGQNRALIAALEGELAAAGLQLPVYWGNRNWDPYLSDTLRHMVDDGIQHAAAFVTAAYSSYSACRQYQDDIAQARSAAGPRAPRISKLRHYFNHPGFVEPMAESLRQALERFPAERRSGVRLLFTAHSIPVSMAEASGPRGNGYVTQLRETARLVLDCLAAGPAGTGNPGVPHAAELVFQSRSGDPSTPWLEPDVLDALDELAAEGVRDVVLCPIGFVSDHMEVLYDLDTEARVRAAELGLTLERAATVGTDSRFLAMIRELVVERAAAEAGREPERPALGALGPAWDVCPAHCCPAPVRRPAG